MMLPPKVRRSTIAAQSRASVNVFVQPEKESLEAMATEFFSSRSVKTWPTPHRPAIELPLGGRGFQADAAVHLSVRGAARRACSELAVRMVMGRPDRCAGDRCCRGQGRTERLEG